MIQEELFKMLKIIKSAHTFYYEIAMQVKKLFDEGHIVLITGAYTNTFRSSVRPFEVFAKDIKDARTWSTFERCIKSIISFNEDDNVIISILVYNGDNFTGIRKTIRWSATFAGTSKESIILFESAIRSEFDQKCKEIYEKEQKQTEQDRLDSIKQILLAKT